MMMKVCVCVDQGVDLRQYSKQVETELQRIEQASIKDCIHTSVHEIQCYDSAYNVSVSDP